MKKTLIFPVFVSGVLLCLSSACSPLLDRGADKPAVSQPPPTLIADGVRLSGLRAERLDSYQTHYLMNYPPEGYQFIRVSAAISGVTDPERWGRDHLELGDRQTRGKPVYARRVLTGDQYEYLANEDFQFRYEFFFITPRSVDADTLSLYISSLDPLSLGTIYEPASSEPRAAIGGKSAEPAGGEYSVIGGGSSNQASATHTTVSGGQLNRASVAYATVGGGRENHAGYLYTTISGGYANLADGRESSIAGGSRNTASGDHSTIGGGIRNQANSTDSAIAGGGYNIANEIYAAIGGGTRNTASGTAAVVSGGAGNHAAGDNSSIAGGLVNSAAGNYSAVLGGRQNSANGNYSLALGGMANIAAADFSTAAGRASQVAANHPGAYLYADSQSTPFVSQAADEYAVRATGGVRFVTAIDQLGGPEVGVLLPSGSGSWEVFSTRSVKTNLQLVHTEEILAGVMQLPLYTWSYRSEADNATHLGPTAEDFQVAFGLGGNPKTIASVDADGVALAALQEIYKQVQLEAKAQASQEERIEQVERQLARLQSEYTGLERQRTLLSVLTILLTVLLMGGSRHIRIPGRR